MKKIIPVLALILFIRLVIPPPTITVDPVTRTRTVIRPTPEITVINTLRQDILNSISF